LPADSDGPSGVTGLVSTNQTINSIGLHWDASVDNVTYTYRTYVVDRVTGNISFTDPPSGNFTADYQYGKVPIPYADIFAEHHGVDTIYTSTGDMVAFMGAFGGPGDTHGTLCASAVVSQGLAANGGIVRCLSGCADRSTASRPSGH